MKKFLAFFIIFLSLNLFTYAKIEKYKNSKINSKLKTRLFKTKKRKIGDYYKNNIKFSKDIYINLSLTKAKLLCNNLRENWSRNWRLPTNAEIRKYKDQGNFRTSNHSLLPTHSTSKKNLVCVMDNTIRETKEEFPECNQDNNTGDRCGGWIFLGEDIVISEFLTKKKQWNEATSFCEGWNIFGKDDWYSPTKEDLKKIYANRDKLPLNQLFFIQDKYTFCIRKIMPENSTFLEKEVKIIDENNMYIIMEWKHHLNVLKNFRNYYKWLKTNPKSTYKVVYLKNYGIYKITSNSGEKMISYISIDKEKCYYIRIWGDKNLKKTFIDLFYEYPSIWIAEQKDTNTEKKIDLSEYINHIDFSLVKLKHQNEK